MPVFGVDVGCGNFRGLRRFVLDFVDENFARAREHFRRRREHGSAHSVRLLECSRAVGVHYDFRRIVGSFPFQNPYQNSRRVPAARYEYVGLSRADFGELFPAHFQIGLQCVRVCAGEAELSGDPCEGAMPERVFEEQPRDFRRPVELRKRGFERGFEVDVHAVCAVEQAVVENERHGDFLRIGRV